MSRKIVGVTVGSPLPKPNLMQDDPRKGDYVHGKEEFAKQIAGGLHPGGTPGQVLTRTETGYEWADIKVPKEYGLISYDQDKTITIT